MAGESRFVGLIASRKRSSNGSKARFLSNIIIIAQKMIKASYKSMLSMLRYAEGEYAEG